MKRFRIHTYLRSKEEPVSSIWFDEKLSKEIGMTIEELYEKTDEGTDELSNLTKLNIECDGGLSVKVHSDDISHVALEKEGF
jgi:hypothetical protein